MRLNTKLEQLILRGVSSAGTVNPEEVLFRIEESMTEQEYLTAEGFLDWLHSNQRTVGFGNIQKRFKEYQHA